MLAEALDLLRCPLCAGRLARRGGALRCPQEHSFDVARQGHVDLLPGGAHRGTADTKEMVAARESFLAAGHFARLREAVAAAAVGAVRAAERATATGAAPGTAAAAEAAASVGGPGCIVDAGAGTGYYLAGVLDRLPDRVGLALDLSKYAMRRAARAHPRIAAAVVCDIWSGLPVADRRADLVLDVFAPRNPAEFRRVLRPGGRLLVVSPTPRHLAELVPTLGLLTVDERKEERLERTLGEFFSLVGCTSYEEPLLLMADEVVSLVGMGPSARHLEPDEVRGRLDEWLRAQPGGGPSGPGMPRLLVSLSVTLAEYAPLPAGLSTPAQRPLS